MSMHPVDWIRLSDRTDICLLFWCKCSGG